MPIVVDEVVITVEVGGDSAAGAGPAPGAAQDAQEIVRECVERVLEILAQREER
ncbi:DUF5908 family protein [Sorangium sp. So ce260]|uniref:DUF5908 family protein n=1 Tax=Sorangium sp. So ce260 TaxID=3133291 RepID=UPI003F636EB3